MIQNPRVRAPSPFNGPIEVGLRALVILTESFPSFFSLQRLVILDYLIVHSDDVPGGPRGLHPQTPHRSGEILVRRKVLEEGLLLYQSRGLVERRFTNTGVFFSATERSGGFLDALSAPYVKGLNDRASWLISGFGEMQEDELQKLASEHFGEWGAEFEMESVLWAEDGV